jgi:hypothetical protein
MEFVKTNYNRYYLRNNQYDEIKELLFRSRIGDDARCMLGQL